MSKIELDDISSGYSLQKINNNFQKIEDEINNKMLSRQPGTEPNVMLDVLDMNSNAIINLPAPSTPTSPVRLKDIDINISQVDVGSDLALIRSAIEPPAFDGKFWFDKDRALYVGDDGQWKPVSGGSSEGGGIVYTDQLDAALTPGVTFFNADTMEHVYSYADDDSVQYLAVPLLAGSGGAAGGSSGGGGTSTLSSADPDGNSLVAVDSTTSAHRLKGVRAGEGVTITSSGSFITIAADVQNAVSENGVNLVTTNAVTPKKVVKKLRAGTGVTLNDTGTEVVINSTGGGTGGGIAYVENFPALFTAGSTLYFPERSEQVFSYNDGDSDQYLAYPLFGGGSVTGDLGGGGGSSSTILQSGTSTDGVTTFTNPSTGTFSFKRVKAGTTNTVVVTESANSVIIDALDVVNAGTTGVQLVKAKTATQVPVKRLLAGTNITLTDSADTVTINATGGGGGTALGDALTRLNSLTPENNNVPVWTAAGVTQFPTTASTRAMMGLSTVANTIPLFTGTSTATTTSLTPFMVSLLAMTGKPTALQHLGITTGNTANGGWLRIATGDSSGFQACWHTIVCNSATTAQGGGFVGSNTSWTFPQVFSATPSVSAFVQDGVQAWITNGSTGNSNTSASFRQQSFVNGPGNAAVSVLAIGFY